MHHFTRMQRDRGHSFVTHIWDASPEIKSLSYKFDPCTVAYGGRQSNDAVPYQRNKRMSLLAGDGTPCEPKICMHEFFPSEDWLVVCFWTYTVLVTVLCRREK